MKKFMVYPGNGPEVVREAVIKRGGWEEVPYSANENIEQIHFVWKPTNFSIRTYARMDENSNDPNFTQVLNHFEHLHGICTKTGLIRTLKQYYYSNDSAVIHRYTVFDSTPTSFILTAGYSNQEYVSFTERFKDLAKGKFSKEPIPDKHLKENIWLIKPANMNQGRGIEIFKKLSDIENFLSMQKRESYWVAQKYIEKPLLYYGRKFDIRMWVLVTHKNEIFYYKQAYMRTSSSDYSTEDKNNYVHLTNNCLQKHGVTYGKFEDGNTLPLEILQDYINQKFPELEIDVKKQIIPRMKDLIIDTILSVKKNLNPKKRKNCFELFGYDFLIDEDFRTWLLEVNTNPYLGIPNTFIKELLPKMMNDLLNIALDPYHPPQNEINHEPNYKNRFELIYCDGPCAYSNRAKNDRSQFNENIYPVPHLAPPPNKFKRYNPFFHAKPDSELQNDRAESLDKKLDMLRPESRTAKYERSNERRMLKDDDDGDGDRDRDGGSRSRERRTPFSFNQFYQPSNGLDYTFKQLENLFDTYPFQDYDPYIPLTARLLSFLINWELHGEKDISMCCHWVRSLSERVSGVLSEPPHLELLIKLIESQNVPLEIQMTVIHAILQICKKFSEKKKLVCDSLVHALSKIAVTSCNKESLKNHDLEIVKLAVNCLCALSGRYDRKLYIPGETRDLDKLRQFLISQGGILALYIVSKLSLEESLKKIIEEQCFPCMDLSDWIHMKKTLEHVKKHESENKLDNQFHMFHVKKQIKFLFQPPFSTPKIDNKKLTLDPNTLALTSFTNIPHALVTREDLPLTKIIEEISDIIQKIKEENKKREKEEEDRKQQHIAEKAREAEEKEKQIKERKKQAEMIFFKRVEEKRKTQEEMAKKLEEDEKTRAAQEDEKRRKKIQEIMKKREEYQKILKANESKRKKAESDVKKYKEVEETKKSEARQILKISFDKRVKSKSKEKSIDKSLSPKSTDGRKRLISTKKADGYDFMIPCGRDAKENLNNTKSDYGNETTRGFSSSRRYVKNDHERSVEKKLKIKDVARNTLFVPKNPDTKNILEDYKPDKRNLSLDLTGLSIYKNLMIRPVSQQTDDKQFRKLGQIGMLMIDDALDSHNNTFRDPSHLETRTATHKRHKSLKVTIKQRKSKFWNLFDSKESAVMGYIDAKLHKKNNSVLGRTPFDDSYFRETNPMMRTAIEYNKDARKKLI